MLEFEGFCSVVCNFNSLLKKLQSVFLTKDALRKTKAVLRKVVRNCETSPNRKFSVPSLVCH